MKQYEAVIKVMEENGGFATLGYLNQHTLKIPGVTWRTKTPYASIRRIVQDERFFFKIRPGLWALKSHRDEVLRQFSLDEDSSSREREEFDHSYYQGLLVEIGNLEGFQTFVPYQDKNKAYLSKSLFKYTTLERFYDFSYEHIVKRAITIDVTWFNERSLPKSFFEVEHTTAIQNSLLKFLDLQDFYVDFHIVAHHNRYKEFESKIAYTAFGAIRERVKFIDYDGLSLYHSRAFKFSKAQAKVNL
ncbi:MAG TPA: hypothetical protein G4N96_05760 [Chloroflexi bacterium]|nr:hypothetical protein [Chloroflexota bacterium]